MGGKGYTIKYVITLGNELDAVRETGAGVIAPEEGELGHLCTSSRQSSRTVIA